MQLNIKFKIVGFILFILGVGFLPGNVFAQRADIGSSITKNVLVLEFNPIIESMGGQRLSDAILNWNDPVALENQYISDLKEVSNNIVDYQIYDRIVIDDIPLKEDGFDYSDQTYLDCWNSRGSLCHSPDRVDYRKILNDYNVCDLVNQNNVDELWIWGGPWFGYWEAFMTGPDSFDTNGPVLTGTSCTRHLHIMGFNYEREVSEMLESLAHRIEGTITHLYNEDPRYSPYPNNTDWGKFAMWDKVNPGNAACGWIHYGPNSENDYDWSNQRVVSSSCNDWLNYPLLTGAKEDMSCSEWGCSGYGFKKWWLSHILKYQGIKGGKLNNWWEYILDYKKAEEKARRNPDSDNDSDIDIMDLIIFIGRFFSQSQLADFNFDNKVGVLDFNVMVNRFGSK